MLPHPCFFLSFFLFYWRRSRQSTFCWCVVYTKLHWTGFSIHILAYIYLYLSVSALQFLLLLHYIIRADEKKTNKKKPTLAAAISSNDLLAFFNHKQFRLLSLARSETEKENTWCSSSTYSFQRSNSGINFYGRPHICLCCGFLERHDVDQ